MEQLPKFKDVVRAILFSALVAIVLIIALNFTHEYFEYLNLRSQNVSISEFVVLGILAPASSQGYVCTGNITKCYLYYKESGIAWIQPTSDNYNHTFINLWDGCWILNMSACSALAKIRWY